MNLVTARNNLRAKIGNPTTSNVLDSKLTRIINAAYKEIAAKYTFNETRSIAYFQTVTNTDRYVLPTDLNALLRVWDDTNKMKLKKRGPRYIGSVPLNVPTGKPLNYVRVKNWMQLLPIPDAVYSLYIYYMATPADLVADADSFILPEPWHDGIVLKARHIYFDENGDVGKAIYANNQWKDWVSDKPSEIDLEKEDYEDAGVILTSLGGEYSRFGYRDRRYDTLFDITD